MKKTKTKKILPKEKSKRPPKIDYKEHWKGMPEFISENFKPLKQIIVAFASKEDILKFSKLVGKEITAKTRSIWFPPISNVPMFDKRYIDKK